MTKKATRIIIILILLVALIFGLYKYIGYRNYCSVHFQSDTTINGVDVSGLTKAETIEKLTDEWNSNTFELVNGSESMMTLKNPKFEYNISKAINSTMASYAKFPVITKIKGNNKEATIAMTVNPTEGLHNKIASLDVCNDKTRIQTTNAYVSMKQNRNFDIIPEVYGTNIDVDVLEQAVLDAIAEGSWTLEYVDSDYYKLPEITTESQEVLDRQAYCKKYLSTKITYEFGNETYTISPTQFEKMIVVDNGTVKVVKSKVKKFVARLAEKYDTIDNYRSFKSTLQGVITIPDGSYGYRIDQDEEKKQLIKDITAGKDVSREPVYSVTGYSRNGVNDILGTYVEVDLSNQKLWYYEGGQCMLSSPFVSGCIKDGFGTSTGAFYLVYKAANVTLKGTNADKTKYATKVKYWMPFYGDLGLHDASWRSSFGGSIYINGGSHGCVNMPPDKAGQLFNMIPYECPILVFY